MKGKYVPNVTMKIVLTLQISGSQGRLMVPGTQGSLRTHFENCRAAGLLAGGLSGFSNRNSK